MFRLVSVILIFCSLRAYSTDPPPNFHWWNLKNNWNGKTHWSEYMRISPGYMGIYAFQFPTLFENNVIQNKGFGLKMKYEHAFQKGENTIALHISSSFVFPKIPLRIDLAYLPFEFYSTDTTIRDNRKARGKSGQGIASGDIWLSTRYKQNLQEWGNINFRFIHKIPTGTHFDDARHSPYYTFSTLISYSTCYFQVIPQLPRISFSIAGGIYSFGLNTKHLHNNNARLYGFGIGTKYISLEYSGFLGEYNNIKWVKLPTDNFPDKDHYSQIKIEVNNIYYDNISFIYVQGLADNHNNTFGIVFTIY